MSLPFKEEEQLSLILLGLVVHPAPENTRQKSLFCAYLSAQYSNFLQLENQK